MAFPALWLLILALNLRGVPQESTSAGNPARAVLDQFLRMDLDGVRLTEEGKRLARPLLTRSDVPPQIPKAVIVSDAYEIRQSTARGETAKFHVFFRHLYGSLNDQLHFEPRAGHASNGALVKDGLLCSYDVVSIDIRANEQRTGEQAPKWRIESLPDTPPITLRAAIRYVTDIQDKSADPILKKRAAATLAVLTKLN